MAKTKNTPRATRKSQRKEEIPISRPAPKSSRPAKQKSASARARARESARSAVATPKRFFSNCPKYLAELTLGIRMKDLHDRVIYEPELFVPLIEVADELYSDVFKELVDALRCRRFPNPASLEGDRTVFVQTVLQKIVNYMMEKLRMPDNELLIESSHVLPKQTDSAFLENSDAKLDLVIKRETKRDREIVRTCLVIVEVKAGLVENSIQQILLYILRSVEQNGMNLGKLYGLGTNGVYWVAVSFDGSNFETLYRMEAMKPQMGKYEWRDGPTGEVKFYLNKQNWLENNSKFVQVICSCLMDQLKSG